MGYRLRMTAEIAEWLGDLRESDPVTGAEVGAALLALMDAADAESLSFVTGTREASEDPRERLDRAYQRMLEGLQHIRRDIAQQAVRRHDAELRLSTEQAAAEPDAAVITGLEREVAAAVRREESQELQCQRLQLAVDLFRARKETAKAMTTAAYAQQRIRDAFLAADVEEDDAKIEAVQLAAAARTDEELARTERLLRIVKATAGLRAAGQRASSDPDRPAVLELHADPLGADVRVLFGLEPPGTAVLLAVLEGEDAIADHRDEAVALAADLLAEIRDNGWSSSSSDAAASGPEFARTGTFLERCFPDNGSVIAKRATELVSLTSLRSLRGERDLAGARRTADVDAHSLVVVERDGLQEASVRDAAAYVRALGGRLELTAVIDGERRALAPTPGNEPA
jgi:phage shock protein A